VFFVHNRVDSIDQAARRLRELVPEARVAVAHGQMSEDSLERVMIAFWEREFDVLVCTTIIESGLDIANANTLVVDRSDLLGLSQLHQLRGRTGRGRERAYAYFLYPPERPLTDTSYDRLTTIAQNTDLGAGMAVAMKDLEIRGAGNLLGGEQSGHIAGVGFDLYVRMVGEAVADFRRSTGDPDADGPDVEPAEVKIDLPIDAHLPHDYIPGERLRMEAYRKLASATTEADVAAVADELTDRYGEPPLPVGNLLAVARFRAHARTVGITEVSLQGRTVRFSPIALRESQELKLRRLHPGSIYKTAVSTISVPRPSRASDGTLSTPPRPGQEPVRDIALLDWCRAVIDSVLDTPAPVETTAP
jgi:transcription-repair coupling factor (superfamily II helicase)